jgi:RNA polymerase sigma-70 factor (ECF subfamily)
MRSLPIKAATKDLPDGEVVQRVMAGDDSAFVLLMRRYNQILYRTARSILKDDAEAEDTVQEAYLLAYRNMDQYRGDARLSTWLVRIVANEALARFRKSRRRAEIIPIDGESEWNGHAIEDMMDGPTREQPENAAARSEARHLLEKKIDELPDAFRTVFVLRAIDEMTVEETAHCLGIPEATVRTRFFRARSLLREALSREIDFAFEDAFSFAGERCDRIVAGVLARLRAPHQYDE